MWDFILRVYRFSFNLSAYGLLMTDEYPRYDGSAPTSMLPPGDRRRAIRHRPAAHRHAAAAAVGSAGRLTVDGR